MGFDFSSILAQFSVALVLLVTIVSVNIGEINSLLSGIRIEMPNMVKLLVNVLVFVFVSSIFLISSVKNNVLKIINKPFEYSIKLLDKFMK